MRTVKRVARRLNGRKEDQMDSDALVLVIGPEAIEKIGAEKHDCFNCRYLNLMSDMHPCGECTIRYNEAPSNWEPEDGEAHGKRNGV